MTHRFHPLYGGTFDVVDRRRCHQEYLYLDVGGERVERVLAAWTSLGEVDPFVKMSAGRSLFRVDDLVRLSEFVAEITDRAEEVGENECK